jgi:hypothetical protein
MAALIRWLNFLMVGYVYAHLTFFTKLLNLDFQIKLLSCYRNTAKTFYAASIFFEIITQFGALQPDVSSCLSYFHLKSIFAL